MSGREGECDKKCGSQLLLPPASTGNKQMQPRRHQIQLEIERQIQIQPEIQIQIQLKIQIQLEKEKEIQIQWGACMTIRCK